eukprot:TRINITY_DN2745_c0_g1_i2.p1 TRINITY_DN2745_c0_g1~~TRINITY_DN2745_c0_g1_i2.p1  ORF type:complete len:161 (+),score=3.79 TRINITY_DN2745_c0_g1_i2:117-599(+)
MRDILLVFQLPLRDPRKESLFPCRSAYLLQQYIKDLVYSKNRRSTSFYVFLNRKAILPDPILSCLYLCCFISDFSIYKSTDNVEIPVLSSGDNRLKVPLLDIFKSFFCIRREKDKRREISCSCKIVLTTFNLSLIHISEPTRLLSISYAVFCLKKKKEIN